MGWAAARKPSSKIYLLEAFQSRSKVDSVHDADYSPTTSGASTRWQSQPLTFRFKMEFLVGTAAEACGISVESFYVLMDMHPDFGAAVRKVGAEVQVPPRLSSSRKTPQPGWDEVVLVFANLNFELQHERISCHVNPSSS